MNNKAISMSIIFALLAVTFVQSYVQSVEEEAKRKFGTEVIVIKASRDIREVETINQSMLMTDVMPKKYVPNDAISFPVREGDERAEKEQQAKIRDLAGAVALVPIKKGEPITYSKITEPSVRTGLSPQVAPGRRAVSVPINEVTGVSKLVKAGDRVDVIAILDAGGGKESRISKTLLQDVVVLAVGRAVTNNVPRVIEPDLMGGKDKVRSLATDYTYTTVTLEVEPSDAQKLGLIVTSSENTLMLALRNNDDSDRVNMGGATLVELLGPDAGLIRAPAGKR